ncbi:methyltransferase family protein [Aliidiomarina sp. Khilg15.8]
MDRLELKVPPLVVVLVTAALMWVVARALPFIFIVPAKLAIALLFAVAGFLVALAGVVEFRRAQTTVNPMAPQESSALVTRGIYRVTRNPMYLGFLLALFGWGVWLSSLPALFLLVGYVLYMNRFQIQPEERFLGQHFGAPFLQYKQQVRRWI